jgi:hypothetical protein
LNQHRLKSLIIVRLCATLRTFVASDPTVTTL